jgi:Rieske Fe-S protein
MTSLAENARGDAEPGVLLDRRRGFFAKALALLIGAAAYTVPAAAAVVAFLQPLRQKGQAGQFLRMTSLEMLPGDGTPRKFPAIMDRSDAWNRFPQEPVGAVYLRRGQEGKPEAIQVVCPHAGCFVEYDASNNNFLCPCHNGRFDLQGKRLGATSPSPRDLDTLEVEIRNASEVWVKFQSFRTGVPQKIADA